LETLLQRQVARLWLAADLAKPARPIESTYPNNTYPTQFRKQR
jgi:hypothetical protein